MVLCSSMSVVLLFLFCCRAQGVFGAFVLEERKQVFHVYSRAGSVFF